MMQHNPCIEKLHTPYLFPLMNKFKQEVLQQNPDAHIISLGIGDTTEPIPPQATKGLVDYARGLGTTEGYSGYGPEQGDAVLRQRIAEVLYEDRVHADEVFVGDGSKCDIGRLQVLFGAKAKIAVQDPVYPVYVFTSVMMGQTGSYNEAQQGYERISYWRCGPENNFFPNVEELPPSDVIFFCGPNNPTGAVYTRSQLERLVAYAKKHSSILVYDTAYAAYIRDPSIPKSIYEIEGAREVAIETGSFSKAIGFTGVRLGWTIVPEELKFEDGTAVRDDWRRISTTFFNGACNIAQAGGIACLSNEGTAEVKQLTDFYLENAAILKKAVESTGCTVYGGDNAPYLWVSVSGRDSWEVFREILETAHVVVTPGVGFGPAGEGFIRMSAFGNRSDIEEAASRLAKVLQQVTTP